MENIKKCVNDVNSDFDIRIYIVYGSQQPEKGLNPVTGNWRSASIPLLPDRTDNSRWYRSN